MTLGEMGYHLLESSELGAALAKVSDGDDSVTRAMRAVWKCMDKR